MLISYCLFSSLPALPRHLPTLPLAFQFSLDISSSLFCVVTCFSFSYIGQASNYRIILLAGSQLRGRIGSRHSS